ncbi:MAG: hypothetical protein AB7P97_20475 [Hyphomonadaceae bacterium]
MARKFDKAKALQAVKDLRSCDHGFLTAEAVYKWNVAFGLKRDAIKPYRARANPRELKGLTFNDGASEGVGYDASDYAEAVGSAVGYGFQPWQMGRGFRLRSACNALEAHFKGQCGTYYQVDRFRSGPRCAHPAGHPGAHYFPGIDDKAASA